MRDDERPADPLSRDGQHDEPLDLVALRADDDLIEALINGRSTPGARSAVDDELAAMLTAWVSEVRPTTSHAAPGADTRSTAAPAVISPVMLRQRPRHRRVSAARYGRIAAAASIVVLAASGLAVGAWESQPGQVLFPVARVVFAERAASLQAAADVSSSLAVARSAMNRGDTQAAAAALAAAQAQLNGVRSSEGHDELAQAQDELIAQLPPGAFDAAVAANTPADGTSRAATDPGVVAAGGDPAAPAASDAPAPQPASTSAPAAPATASPAPVVPAPVTPAPVTSAPAPVVPVGPTTTIPEPTLGSDAPASPAPASTAPTSTAPTSTAAESEPVEETTPETTENPAPETTTPEVTPSETMPSETMPSETMPSETTPPETTTPETTTPETTTPETTTTPPADDGDAQHDRAPWDRWSTSSAAHSTRS